MKHCLVKRILFLVLIAVACAVPLMAQVGHFRSVGEFLYARGYRNTIGLPDGSGKVLLGTFRPDVPYDGRLIGKDTRYGFPSLVVAYIRGPEGTSPEMLQQVVQHPTNPFQLQGNLTYTVTQNDYFDALYVRFAGRRSVWNWIDQLRVDLGLQATSPPAEPPPVVTPPTTEPKPPAPPPARSPGETEPCDFQPSEVPAGKSVQVVAYLYLELPDEIPSDVQPEPVVTPPPGGVYYRPGTASTGRLNLQIVNERPCRVKEEKP